MTLYMEQARELAERLTSFRPAIEIHAELIYELLVAAHRNGLEEAAKIADSAEKDAEKRYENSMAEFFAGLASGAHVISEKVRAAMDKTSLPSGPAGGSGAR